MANLDKQVEAIRAAFRERESGLSGALFKDDEGQDWQEDFTGGLEKEVKYRNIDASRSAYMGRFLEDILRAELATMMNEYHSAMHFSHFLNTHSDEIRQAIVKRLRDRKVNGRPAPVYIQKGKLRDYLNGIKNVFRAKLARGEEISATDFIEVKLPTENQQGTSQANPPLSRKGRGKSKKKSARKQGRKQALMGFESIKEAATQTGQNYNTLKSTKRRHELNSI